VTSPASRPLHRNLLGLGICSFFGTFHQYGPSSVPVGRCLIQDSSAFSLYLLTFTREDSAFFRGAHASIGRTEFLCLPCHCLAFNSSRKVSTMLSSLFLSKPLHPVLLIFWDPLFLESLIATSPDVRKIRVRHRDDTNRPLFALLPLSWESRLPHHPPEKGNRHMIFFPQALLRGRHPPAFRPKRVSFFLSGTHCKYKIGSNSLSLFFLPWLVEYPFLNFRDDIAGAALLQDRFRVRFRLPLSVVGPPFPLSVS